MIGGLARDREAKRRAGFSYIEVLVAMAILAVALVPAMDALHAGVVGSEVHGSLTEQHYRLTGKLEEMLSEPFASLDEEALAIGDPNLPSAVYSDPAGTADRRLVYLSRYDGDDVSPSDGDPFTGVDEGLVWIRVEIEGTPLVLERLVDDFD